MHVDLGQLTWHLAVSDKDVQLTMTIKYMLACGTVCTTHTQCWEIKGSSYDTLLILLSKNGQRDPLLFFLRQLSSELPGPTLGRQGGTCCQEQPRFRVSRGICLVAAAFPHFCMHTQTQVPREGPHLMQTHNLWNCVLIGYSTYARPYLPKTLRKIIECHFFP